jgi:hypothetical protein
MTDFDALSHASETNTNKYELDTVMVSNLERFGMNGIDSGSTPEPAYRALLRQVAITVADSDYVAMATR